jgi:toxin FitB
VNRQVLLDTSVVIAPPSSGFAGIADAVAVSAITIAELEYGVEAASDPVERQRRRRRVRLLVDAIEVLPFDLATASSYGMLSNVVRAAGRDPRPRRLDLLIAATAERHGLSVATRNAADFRHLERVLHIVEVT